MKRKDYEKLLDKLWHADRAFSGWRMEIADYNPADGNYSYEQLLQERDKAKVVLDKYKAELEDILSVDMEVFLKDILKYINETHDKEYEIMQINIQDSKLWVARPIGKRIMTTQELVFELEDVYVLGKDDKKVLPHQAVIIGEDTYPTMCSFNDGYTDAYFIMIGKERVRYKKFIDFMKAYEEKLVESYDLKKKKRM